MSYNSLFGLGSHSPDASLEGWWQLQSNFNDSSGKGITLSDTGGGTLTQVTGPTSYLANGYKGDGTSYLQSSATFSQSNVDTTVLGWLRLDSTASGTDEEFAGIYSNDCFNASRTNTSATRLFNNTTQSTVSSPLTPYQWTHFAARYRIDSNDDDIFINAVEDSATGGNVSYTTTPSTLRFFRERTTQSSRVFIGSLAGWSWFSRQLTEAEIAEAYNGPEPINTVLPTLNMGVTSWTGTIGTWDSQNNGDVSYTWELRLVEDDSVVESGGGEYPQGTGTYNNANGYYLAVDATNDGGTDLEARSKVGTLGIGLSGWWSPSITDSAEDLSSEGNDGSLLGGVSTVADTSEGGSRAFDFDGVDDRVDFGDILDTEIFTTGNPFTLCGWAQIGSDGVVVFAKILDSSAVPSAMNERQFIMWCRDAGGGMKFEWLHYGTLGTSSYRLYRTVANLSVGDWHHLTAVYNGPTGSNPKPDLYIDGTLASTTLDLTNGTDSAMDNGAASLSTGAGSGGSSYTFPTEGRTDDLRVYNRALSAAEINELYTSGRGYDHRPKGLGDEKLWLCPSIEDSANDLSGNGNHATYEGGMGTVADTSEGGSRAYALDGVDDAISAYETGVGGAGGWADFMSDGTFSASVWVKYDNINTGALWAPTWSTRNRLGYYGFSGGMRPLANNATWQYYYLLQDNGLSYEGLHSPSPAQDDQWHHVCWSSTAGVAKLYVDGVYLADLGAGDLPSSAIQTSLYFGKGRNWNYLNGRMDDIRIFDRAITAAEAEHLATGRGVLGSPAQGLGDEVAWYCPTLSGNAGDLSGNGNAGTYNGGMGVVDEVDSGGKKAFEFDGVDDYIELTTGVVSSTSPLSICGWIKVDATTQMAMVSDYHNSFNDRSVFLGPNSTAARGIVSSDGVSFTVVEGGTSVTTGAWRHLAMTHDPVSGDVGVFIDGVSVATGTQTGRHNTGRPWAIGSTNTDNVADNLADGLMDDIRIYGRILTQDEIAHLASDRGVQGTPIVGLGDERAWLCPSIDNSARDLSGNGNDGTTTGTLAIVADAGEGGTRAFETLTTSTDRVDLPAGILTNGNDVTLSYWVKNKQTTAGSGTRYLARVTNDHLYTYANGTRYRAVCSDGTTTLIATDELGALNTTEYLHYAAIYRQSTDTIDFYRDGVLEATDTDVALGALTLNGTMELLRSSFAYLDDFRAFNRALTDAEITHLATGRGVLGSAPTGLGDEAGWWCPTLSGNAGDLSGNGNAGEYNGSMGVTHYDDGTAAFEFDGTDDYVDIASFSFTGDFSFGGWAKIDSTGDLSLKPGIFSTELTGSSWFTLRVWSTGAINCDIRDANGNRREIQTSTTYNDDQWHHLFAKVDRTNDLLIVFIDGVSVLTGDLSAFNATVSGGFDIGWAQAGSRYFTGDADDARIYERALTTAEINHLASERGVTGTPPIGLGDEVAWYCPTLTDNAVDLSGNNNDGTYNGGMGTVSSTGEYGLRAFEFDGADDYIGLPDSTQADLIPGTDPITFSAWIKPDTISGGDTFGSTNPRCIIVKEVSYNVQVQYLWRILGGKPDFVYRNQADSTFIGIRANSHVVTANDWQHLAVVHDTTEVRHYLNGVELPTTLTGTIGPGNSWASTPRIGGQTGTRLFDGEIDDIRIYDHALTTTEITYLASRRGIEGGPSSPNRKFFMMFMF